MLNKQNGNMYSFVTHTWNPVKGKCPHDCIYCYMKVFPQKDLRITNDIDDSLGENKYIFVGSSTDMWCKDVPDYWIDSVLERCRTFQRNTYLFQSKNPARFEDWVESFPTTTVLATTIESSRCCCDFTPQAPCISERLVAFKKLPFRKTITIEPIMDFDLKAMVANIRDINPEFVSIGADSKNHKLPEPPAEKVKLLISELSQFTKVKQKDNLSRILCR